MLWGMIPDIISGWVDAADRSRGVEIESRSTISFWRVMEKAKFCAPGVTVQPQVYFARHFHLVRNDKGPYLINIAKNTLCITEIEKRKGVYLCRSKVDWTTEVTAIKKTRPNQQIGRIVHGTPVTQIR